MFDKIGLIGVPSSAGAHGVGQEKAPQALRRAGLVTGLESSGIEVNDFGDLPLALYQPRSANRKQQNLARVVDVARRVAERVDEVLKQHLTPVVIGGDCTITLGVLAGYLRHVENLGLLYFDGDIDLNTPATTHSGIFDSMGMAHMIGEGADALSHIGLRFPLMREDQIVLFGFDPLEVEPWQWEALEQRQMLRFPVTSFNGQPAEIARSALSQLEQGADVVLVHFDVDSIDSADFPLADFPHHNEGQSLSEALECLRIFCASPKCGGLVVTEVNPDHDVDGSMVPTFTRLLVKALTEAPASSS
jgi:arginase